MTILEFHFNPKDKDDLIFDTFSYFPENIYEKRMGGIYMIGELKSALPHNYRLLEKTSTSLKKEFYSKFQRTHEQALKESLKKANEMLSGEVSKENTDWLGNLNFAIIAIKNFELNFTKVGNIKVFLIRGPHIINIGEKLDNQEIEPYPLKIFNNIVSGKIGEGDTILAITENVFPALKGAISQISKIFPFDEKKVKDIMKKNEQQLAAFSGGFILINITKEPPANKKPKVIFERSIEKFQIAQVFQPARKYSKKLLSNIKSAPGRLTNLRPRFKLSLRLPKISLPKLKKRVRETKPEQKEAPLIVPKRTGPIKIKVKMETDEVKIPDKKITIPKITVPKITIPKIRLRVPRPSIPKPTIPRFNFSRLNPVKIFNKKYISVLFLIITLIVGFFIFRRQEIEQQKKNEINLKLINEKVIQAESMMRLRNISPETGNKAVALLSEAWDEISILISLDGATKAQASLLQATVEGDLETLSNLVKIDSPEIIFQFNTKEFIPQRVISDGKNVYAFSPYSEGVFKISDNKEGRLFSSDKKFSFAASISEDNLLFFTKPNEITPLEDGQLGESFVVSEPYDGYDFSEFVFFDRNIYFLDRAAGKITKYPKPIQEGKNNPQLWLKNISPQAESMAIDGSVWILDDENNISEYHSGKLVKTISPNIFPKAKSFSKIWMSIASPYIFIMEPAQNRIIILDKQGNAFKQFESQKFDNLLDFAFSKDGKTIFILNGLNLYQIKI